MTDVVPCVSVCVCVCVFAVGLGCLGNGAKDSKKCKFQREVYWVGRYTLDTAWLGINARACACVSG